MSNKGPTSQDRLWNIAPRGRSWEKSDIVPGQQPMGCHNSRLWLREGTLRQKLV